MEQQLQKISLQRKNMVRAVPSHIDQNIVRTFYYDESNNLGKLWLKPYDEENVRFNADVEQNFVIAGIVTSHDLGIDQKTLLNRFGLINAQTTELKFKEHFSQPDFLCIIGRLRTLNFLKLIDELEVDIHVININNLYFGIVDIIDDFIDIDALRSICIGVCPIICNPESFFLATYCGLKELLYDILHANLKKTETLFVKYHYPNIKDEEQIPFCDELLNLLKSGVHSDRVDTWYFDSMFGAKQDSRVGNRKVNAFLFYQLIAIIEAGRKKSDAVLLKHNKDNVLIDNYALWYLHPVALFPKSTHIFDKSRQITQEMNKIELKEGNKILSNYMFVDSKDSIGVQLSDVIAGLYGKLYTYANKKTKVEMMHDAASLNENQFECLRLLNKFQKNSNAKNEGYFYSTVPTSFMSTVASWLDYCEIAHMRKQSK